MNTATRPMYECRANRSPAPNVYLSSLACQGAHDKSRATEERCEVKNFMHRSGAAVGAAMPLPTVILLTTDQLRSIVC